MFRSSCGCCLSWLLLTAFPWIAQADDSVAVGAESSVQTAVNQEDAARQQQLDEARTIILQGREQAAAGDFAKAYESFAKAREQLGLLSGSVVVHERQKLAVTMRTFAHRWVSNLEDQARAAFAEKLFDKAIVFAREAQRVDGIAPARSEHLKTFIEECEAQMAAVTFTEDSSLVEADPEKEAREYDVDVSLAQAKKLIAAEQFTRARDALEKVLVRDPYDVEAMETLKRVYRELFRRGNLRRKNDYVERVAEVEWKWSEAVLPLPAIKDSVMGATVARSQSLMQQKLNQLIIDHIEMEEATIAAVVKHLVDQSRRVDVDKTGVSIILNMKEDSIVNVPTITMSFDDIPLIEIIRYICQACDLRYRVENHAVIIGTDAIDPMDTKFFQVRAALISGIVPEGAEAGAEEDAFGAEVTFDAAATLGDAGKDEEGGKQSVTSEALMAYFVERGVSFPESSTIAYDKRAGKLVVRNNYENLRRLELLLRDLDIETPLVLIEAKFVEITQTDLEDFGFQWLFSKDTWPTTTSTWTIPENDSTLRPLGINASGITSPVNSGVNSRLINNALIMPAFGPNNTRHLTMYLHALDQSGTLEVLSSPKVLATSGQQAIVRMIREEYYPESWTEPELTAGTTNVSFTPSYPELGEPTPVGINLEVTPTVSPNNYTIALQLSPSVIERVNWTDYSYIISLGPATLPFQATEIMPEISRRDITTSVRVYDGQTLVLGGMLRDRITAVDDRIPLLGDIPLLGRLARTKNEESEKINLMIFVTARLVNPDGLPVRVWDDTKGLPDFRRL